MARALVVDHGAVRGGKSVSVRWEHIAQWGGRTMTTPQKPWDRATSIWATEFGLSVFTGLLVVEVFVVSPLATLGVLGTGLIDVVFTLLLLCGVLALHPGRILRVLVVIFVGIAIGLRWMAVWQPVAWIVGVGSLLAVVTFGCFAAIVLTRVFETGPVTRHRIHGAVCAYLLFGLTWARRHTPASRRPSRRRSTWQAGRRSRTTS